MLYSRYPISRSELTTSELWDRTRKWSGIGMKSTCHQETFSRHSCCFALFCVWRSPRCHSTGCSSLCQNQRISSRGKTRTPGLTPAGQWPAPETLGVLGWNRYVTKKHSANTRNEHRRMINYAQLIRLAQVAQFHRLASGYWDFITPIATVKVNLIFRERPLSPGSEN